MLDQKDIETKVLKLRRALHAKLGVKGRDLAQALRRAGRRLPRHLRTRGAQLVQAEFFARNPKMARRLDSAEVDAAFDEVMTHLGAIDLRKERVDRLLGIAGAIAFNLLVVLIGFTVFLWWRGYV